MSELDLSVIIVNYNTPDLTVKCLDSLSQAVNYCEDTLSNEVEVIVIDNASTDDSFNRIKKFHSWVRLYKSDINTGFSGGNNLGLQKSTKPFILLLNSDAFVQKDTLVKALEFFQTTPDCDVLGCKLTYEDGKLQKSGGFLPDIYNTAFWMLGLEAIPILGSFIGPVHPRDDGFFERERQLEWVTGAFFLMKRKVYEATRGFDRNLFMYMEEVELCMRIKQAGFKVYYTPSFSVVHLSGGSSGFNIQKPLIAEMKGLVYYFTKYYPSQLPLLKLLVILGSWLRILIFTLFNKPDKRQAYFEILKII